ncbi:MAG TPA: hypothetical protein VF521_11190 [Pyrinomonadaceae bacterium]
MFPRKPRTAIKAFALAVVCALLLSGLIPLHTSHAAAQPKIRWSEKQLDATVAPGGGSVRQVSFTSDQNLRDVSIETTPSLAGLVSVRPTQIASAFADQPQTVTLFISAPADATPGVRGGTIHVRSGSQTLPLPLNVSVEVKQGVVDVDLPVPQPISPADVTLVGTSETAFNPQSTTLRFAVSGATLDTNPAGVEVIVNGASAPATSLQITNSSVAVPVFLAEGRNDVSLFAWDTQGSLVAKTATLWAGSYTMQVAVYDENGQPSTGALVTARLGDDKEVKATATSSSGSVFFGNLPNWTVILEASASGNRIASVATNGGAGFAQLRLRGFNAASTIDNDDFSLGTAGWETGSAPVFIIPHDEGTFVPLEDPSTTSSFVAAAQTSSPSAAPAPDAPASSTPSAPLSRAELHSMMSAPDQSAARQAMAQASTAEAGAVSALDATEPDNDLVLATSGEGPQTISRTVAVEPGTQEVKVRYKFVTTEVPGGYYGTQYNDYFNLSIRTQAEGGAGTESQTMNGLGLSSFDAGGATDWREFDLPVNVDGDTVQVDMTVANVADGYLDSYLVVDVVAKPKIKIAPLTAVIKNDTATVNVKMSTNAPTDVTLTLLTKAGTTGEAHFDSNNSTTMTINSTTDVVIRGITESSKRDNIRLQATRSDGKKLDDEDFGVLWVTMEIRFAAGAISKDNGARSAIGKVQGTGTPVTGTYYHTGSLAAIGKFWGNAVEIVGTVYPSDFDKKVKLVRWRIQSNYYYGANNTLEAGNGGGAKDDTSPDVLRDDKPKPNGKVYDYDAPGLGTLPAGAAVGATRRQRANFREWATFEGKRASDELFWFSRISIIKTAGQDALATDVANDNMAGQGATALTWNLQP